MSNQRESEALNLSWTRRRFLQSGLAGATALALPSGVQSADSDSVYIGNDRQLFFDDRLIDSELTNGVIRSLNRPLRIERVMKPEQPSESLGFIFYCSVVDDGGTAKLFHGSYDADKKKHFALATSQDGIHWERPRLGLREYRGSRNNNLLPVEAVEASVFLDPQAPASRRYRLLYSRFWPDPKTAGVYLASSPDGINWTKSAARLLPFVPDSQHCGLWDARLRKYVIYTRNWNPDRAIARVAVDDIETPWPYDRSVPPHHVWGKDRVPTLSRELPTVMSRDDRDPPGVQLYTNAVSTYPAGADQSSAYIAFPAAYQTFNGPEWKGRALNVNDGNFDIQFASSPDGITWNRWRQPYIAAGYHDGLNLRLVSMGQGLVRRGRNLYQYFVGWPHTHGRPVVWDRDLKDRAEWLKKDLGGIYCATQRVDGFVSMNSGFPAGRLTTRPLRFTGNSLRLNLKTEGSGGVRVALLDATGNLIKGFGRDECEWINTDSIDHAVTWRSGAELSSLSEQPVRLEFTLRNAHLYAFQISNTVRAR